MTRYQQSKYDSRCVWSGVHLVTHLTHRHRRVQELRALLNRLHHHVSSMVSIRHNEGFDSLSNNLGRIPNLARAGREQIHYILFYFLLLAG